MKPIAIIPARGGSKRFPRKNIASLNGKPLLSYGIETALASSLFGCVVVTTEDQEIANVALSCGAEVFGRHPQLATDNAHELDACLEVIEQYAQQPEYFCVIYPTAVQMTTHDLEGSYELITGPNSPSVVMAVSTFNYHPYKTLIKDENGKASLLFPDYIRERSQTYPKALASNGMFYWVHTEELMKNRNKGYYQEKLFCYEIPAERAIDIDYPEDLQHVETIINSKSRS